MALKHEQQHKKSLEKPPERKEETIKHRGNINLTQKRNSQAKLTEPQRPGVESLHSKFCLRRRQRRSNGFEECILGEGADQKTKEGRNWLEKGFSECKKRGDQPARRSLPVRDEGFRRAAGWETTIEKAGS